jgi:RNA 3'-terminal phosphate cyclase (ATP)
MITIDGSAGEGGGQILRSSLALSILTGQPFRITQIRAGRAKPGLLRQHLTSVRAATAICGARVSGDALGSGELSFTPGAVIPGDYSFDIGSAGATSLVLQTVLLPLLLAKAPSRVQVDGGTHNPAAPPFRFLQASFVPKLRAMGADLDVELTRWGFYPAGGGRLTATLNPSRLAPITVVDRGAITAWRVEAWVSGVPYNVAHREVAAACEALDIPFIPGAAREVERPRGPGNVMWIEADHAAGTTVFTGFGEKRVSAEEVARSVAKEALLWRDDDVPVDEHLADQLLMPLALAGGGELRIGPPSQHTLTQIEVLRTFLGTKISTERDGVGLRVTIGG